MIISLDVVTMDILVCSNSCVWDLDHCEKPKHAEMNPCSIAYYIMQPQEEILATKWGAQLR